MLKRPPSGLQVVHGPLSVLTTQLVQVPVHPQAPARHTSNISHPRRMQPPAGERCILPLDDSFPRVNPSQPTPGTPPPMSDDTQQDEISRRSFIQRVSFFGGSMVLLGSCSREPVPAKKTEQPGVPLASSHVTLTDEEFEAMAAA